MALTCLELINTSIVKEGLKLAAGKGGADRRIMWTHFLESFNAIRFLQKGELVFITGLHIKGNPRTLAAAIEAISAKSAAGAVITTGDMLEHIPAEVLQKADNLNFPIFEMPWHTDISAVIQRISKIIVSEKSAVPYDEYNIFESVMFADNRTYEDIRRKTHFYGFDLGDRSAVMSLKAQRDISEEEKRLIYHTIKRFCERKSVNFVTVWRREELFMIISADKLRRINTGCFDFCSEISEILCKSFPDIRFSIGLSNVSDTVFDIKRECDNSLLALKISGLNPESGITEYKDLGIYRFLSQIDNEALLREYLDETFGKLTEYDERRGTDFMNTLEEYIGCGRSVSHTAQKLFIHRNTLTYRLKKIEEILGINLDAAEGLLETELAFKIKNLLE